MNTSTYRIGLVQAQAYRHLQVTFRSALKPYGLTIPEWSLLGVVYDEGQLGLTQITEILKSKASHPTVLVDRLVELGMLTRENQSNDRRVKTVAITPLGRDLVPIIEANARIVLSKSLKSLSREDLEHYFSLLQRIADIAPE
jgi:DNA-binding MarR family transcriptional regulator